MTRLRRIGLVTVALVILPIGLLQLGHLARFGHFFPYGLHADVMVRRADYGIDGITKAYEAKLTNYGITPANVIACDFIDDAGGHGTLVGSKVQKFDPSTKNWEDVFKTEKSEFCRPYPLGMIETQIITKRLWPGQSISGGEEATAVRDVFSIGDKARIVAFARDGLTFHTAAFSIDEHPSRPGVPYRVRH
jgi:hypothetical protein